MNRKFKRARSGILLPEHVADANVGSVFFSGAQFNRDALNFLAALEFYIEFSQNDATSIFLDSVGNWPFTVRNTAGLDTTANQTANATPVSAATGRYYHPNTVEGNTAYIPLASNFKLPNSGWTIGGWIQGLNIVAGSSRFLMGNIGATGTDFQAYLSINGVDNKVKFIATTDGTAVGQTILDSTVVINNSWWFMTASLDRVANQITTRIRGAVGGGPMVKASTAFAGALFTGASTANFNINDGLSNDNTYFAGIRAGVIEFDQAFHCLLGDAFTDSMFDYLYNAGNGKTYTQIRHDAGAGP